MKPNKTQQRLIDELVRSVQMIEQNNAPEEKKDNDLEHVKSEYLEKILGTIFITEENIKDTHFRHEGTFGLLGLKQYNLEDIELHFDFEGRLYECYLTKKYIETKLPIKYMFELESIIKDLYK